MFVRRILLHTVLLQLCLVRATGSELPTPEDRLNAKALLGTTSFRHRAPVLSVVWSRQGRLITAGLDGFVRVWCAKTGKLLADAQCEAVSVTISSDEKMIVAGTKRGVVTWRWKNAKKPEFFAKSELFFLTKNKLAIWKVAISNDRAFLAAADSEGTVRAWRIRDRKEVLRLAQTPRLDNPPPAVLLFDGTKLVTYSSESRTVAF